MPSTHSKNLEIFNAKRFKESVSGSSPSNVYLTIGKTTPWPSESNPPNPTTSVVDVFNVYKNMLGGKKITGNDIRHCVPRFDWSSGRVWNQYEDYWDSLLLKTPDNPFYVITDDFNVYKCLSNNYGAVSTVKPTSTSTSLPFQTSDKYVWKYMYSVSAEDQLKFTTPDFIPVKTLTIADGSTQWVVQNTAVDGAINTIQITNQGVNYNVSNIWVTITGDGTGANAFPVRNTYSRTITDIIVDDPGRGYTRANVYVYGGTGQGALARAVISPPGGHGKDPVTELGGSYIMMSVQTKGSESNKLTISNDFRQISIIVDPLKRGTTSAFTNSAFSQLTTVSVSGVSVNYEKDEYVYQGTSFRNSTFRGIVSDWDETNNILKLYGVEGSPENDKLIGYTSSAVRQLLASTVQPELEVNSGKLLYIDNIAPIQRDSNQNEDFKVVLSF